MKKFLIIDVSDNWRQGVIGIYDINEDNGENTITLKVGNTIRHFLIAKKITFYDNDLNSLGINKIAYVINFPEISNGSAEIEDFFNSEEFQAFMRDIKVDYLEKES
jgi:hypothetical protein